jgi:hypothetical protein
MLSRQLKVDTTDHFIKRLWVDQHRAAAPYQECLASQQLVAVLADKPT